MSFSGFSKETFKFFSDLEKNNSVEWFNNNKSLYTEFLVEPAREFVKSIGGFFNQLNPAIRTEPKFNQTLMRMNKDMRFAKGAPYKDFFLIHFGRFKMDSEFYVFLNKEGITYGMFLNNSEGEDLFFKGNMVKHRKDFVDAFTRYKLNKKFSLHKMDKQPELLFQSFDIKKNEKEFFASKHILLEKSFSLKDKIIYSPDFLAEAVKTFSQLYPLYCFAISPSPLRYLEDFNDRLGTAV